MDSDAALTPYELRVKRNIEENQRVLRSLGLLNPSSERKETIKKTVRRSNVDVKSRNSFKPSDEPVSSPALLARRTRRSSSILKSQGYDEFDDVPIAADEENTPPHKRKKIAPEPVFGPIEGVNVGDWWSTRMECSAACVHRPTVAGIHGKLGEGCFSIALSGGYEDDVDYGEYFTYTGSGGRDLKGTKTNPKNLRTAPQTKDQVLEGPNAALALNIESHRPVRVIRGYKLPSPYAPEEGYRYDGLYSVERCWTTTGLSGFKVYKFALKRLPDQDPAPWVTNGSITPAQNGHGKSEEDGQLEEENDDHSKTQSITSDVADITRKCLKSPSKCSPNSVQNIENYEDITVTENDSQMTPKGKRTSLESEETRKQSPPRDSLNSPQQPQDDEGETLKQIQVTPERSNRLSDSKINSEAIIKDSESILDSLNSDQNISESKDDSGKQSQITLKRKRTPSNAKLYTTKTQKESKSPENSMQNVSEDKDENKLQTQMTPKKSRLSSSSMLGIEDAKQEQKSPTCTLNTIQIVENDKGENNAEDMLKRNRLSPINSMQVLEGTLPESKPPTDLPNHTTVESDNNETEEQTQMTPKRTRVPSIPKLDPEGTKQKLHSPKDSLNSMQSTSYDKVVCKSSSEVILKRNRRSSSSKPDIEGTLQESKCHTGSLNGVKNVTDNNDETAVQTHMTSKRKRSPSTLKLGPKGTSQKPESPTDILVSGQNVLEDEDVSDKFTQKGMKRNRRSSNQNRDSVLFVQESSSSNNTNGFEINTKNEHNRSDIVIPVDIDRLNGEGKLENGVVNDLKLNKKSTDEENPKFLSCNNQQNHTVHTGIVDNATTSPDYNCQVQLTRLSSGCLNSQGELKSTGKSPNSTEKKVRFSPEVVFNYVQEKNRSVKNILISSLESENQNSARKLDYSTCGSVKPIEIGYSRENDQTRSNSGGDSKKQTSILKYFGPARKVGDNRASSRGILLRSNRRSVVSNNFLPILGSNSLKSDSVPMKNSPSPHAKKLKAPSNKESTQSKRVVKAFSAKTNRNSSSKKKESLSPASSPVKPCSVSLFRMDTTLITNSLKAAFEDRNQLEDPFLGWDWSINEVKFLGFDSWEEPLFCGFEKNSEHLKDFLLIRSVIAKLSEAL